MNDALVHRSVTARWFFAMRSGVQSAWKHANQIKVPILVLQAGADEIVDPKAPELWLENVPSPDKTFRPYPDHLHELLNEPDWPVTAGTIADWLDARIAPSRLAFAPQDQELKLAKR